MKRLTPTRQPARPQRDIRVAQSTVDNLPGHLRVEDCELQFKDGAMAVTFRLSLSAPSPRCPSKPNL